MSGGEEATDEIENVCQLADVPPEDLRHLRLAAILHADHGDVVGLGCAFRELIDAVHDLLHDV